ncbi:MAG: hypothetical protein ACI8S6_003510 [Myxococcota bacterium]|jgi:hypothetical protein
MLSMLLCAVLARAAEPVMPDFVPSNAAAEAQEASAMSVLLDTYIERAEVIFVGEVLSASHPHNNPIHGTRAIFTVKERISGDVSSVMDVLIPPVGDYFDADPFPVPIAAVSGYTMLVFVDGDGNAIAHNALFLVEGGYAWRAKRADVFLDPIRDRLWTESIDPSRDYVLSPIEQVRQQVAVAEALSQVARRPRRRDR